MRPELRKNKELECFRVSARRKPSNERLGASCQKFLSVAFLLSGRSMVNQILTEFGHECSSCDENGGHDALSHRR
ncbi:hypothetical protein C1M53_17950 [Mesorhizobium sp. Pch-S]|nr:hypothetical protein C1M53_17950 [Mesorhizobium sp. Pch-S]